MTNKNFSRVLIGLLICFLLSIAVYSWHAIHHRHSTPHYTPYESFVLLTTPPDQTSPDWGQAFQTLVTEFEKYPQYQIILATQSLQEAQSLCQTYSSPCLTCTPFSTLKSKSFYSDDVFDSFEPEQQLSSIGVFTMLEYPHSALYDHAALTFFYQNSRNSQEFLTYLTGTIDLFGYFVYQVGALPGHFSLSPTMLIFHEDWMSREWILRTRADFYQKYHQYFQLIAQKRQILSSHDHFDIDEYQKSLNDRFNWLVAHPEISAYESGFFNQALGEDAWQKSVWDHRAAYILIPEITEKAPYAYHSIAPFHELELMFPQFAQDLLLWFLLQDDLADGADRTAHQKASEIWDRLPSEVKKQVQILYLDPEKPSRKLNLS